MVSVRFFVDGPRSRFELASVPAVTVDPRGYYESDRQFPVPSSIHPRSLLSCNFIVTGSYRGRRVRADDGRVKINSIRVARRIVTSCRIIYPCIRWYAGKTNIFFCLMSRTENGLDTRADDKKIK